jgi:S4 domain
MDIRRWLRLWNWIHRKHRLWNPMQWRIHLTEPYRRQADMKQTIMSRSIYTHRMIWKQHHR